MKPSSADVELLQLQQRRQSHRCREDVVGRLAVVDVVVGMNVLVLAARAAQQLRGAVGDDLVAVHVEADARARLEYIDGEVLVPLAFLNFFRRFDNRLRRLLVDEPQLAIGQRRRFFHHRDGADQRAMSAQPADRKVLDRARRLNAVVNVAGNFLVSERIFLDASRPLFL